MDGEFERQRLLDQVEDLKDEIQKLNLQHKEEIDSKNKEIERA